MSNLRGVCHSLYLLCSLHFAITAAVVLLVVVVAVSMVSGRLLMVETPSASMDLNSRFYASSAAAYSATAS